jgi:hypothetical protein
VLAIAVISAASIRQDKTAKSADKPSASDGISGSYEGVILGGGMDGVPIKIVLKSNNGKLSGTIETPQGTHQTIRGTYTEGHLELTLDGTDGGTITARAKDGTIVGNWSLRGVTGTLELKAASTIRQDKTSKPADKPSASDEVDGSYEGIVTFTGDDSPIKIVLKSNNGKLSGTMESPQDKLQSTGGTYTDGHLELTFETPNGVVTITAQVKDDKIVGNLSLQGTGGPLKLKRVRVAAPPREL